RNHSRRWARTSERSPRTWRFGMKMGRISKSKVGSTRCDRAIELRFRMTQTSHSVADTERIAGELARTLRSGEVVALHGELGAGKTQFTRGVVRALGGDVHAVSSPTFVLLNVYDTARLKVFHLDAYRVHG